MAHASAFKETRTISEMSSDVLLDGLHDLIRKY